MAPDVANGHILLAHPFWCQPQNCRIKSFFISIFNIPLDRNDGRMRFTWFNDMHAISLHLFQIKSFYSKCGNVGTIKGLILQKCCIKRSITGQMGNLQNNDCVYYVSYIQYVSYKVGLCNNIIVKLSLSFLSFSERELTL